MFFKVQTENRLVFKMKNSSQTWIWKSQICTLPYECIKETRITRERFTAFLSDAGLAGGGARVQGRSGSRNSDDPESGARYIACQLESLRNDARECEGWAAIEWEPQASSGVAALIAGFDNLPTGYLVINFLQDCESIDFLF